MTIPSRPFRVVTIADRLRARPPRLHRLPTLRHPPRRRAAATTLGPLADLLGCDRSLAKLRTDDVEHALTTLLARTTRLHEPRSRAIVRRWLRWCVEDAGEDTPVLVDVRTSGEYRTGWISGAVNLPSPTSRNTTSASPGPHAGRWS